MAKNQKEKPTAQNEDELLSIETDQERELEILYKRLPRKTNFDGNEIPRTDWPKYPQRLYVTILFP